MNTLNYNKLYTLGGGTEGIKTQTKKEVIEEILTYPAVAVRGHRDDLIEYIESDDKAPLQWIKELKERLETLDEAEVRGLKRFIKNRIGVETKKY